MVDFSVLSAILKCLDTYMIKQGKKEINDIEANCELARVGLLTDSLPNPGKPLRELLVKLRDSNHLPQNIHQKYGAWYIKISSCIAKLPLVNQFQYC